MTAGSKTVLRLAGSVALIAVVLWQINSTQILSDLRGASLLWAGLAVCVLALQIPLSAWRWQVTARALGVPIARDLAMREYGLSVLVNTFLPGGVLGDLGRVVRMRGVAGWQLAAASVVIERLSGQIAMALAAVCGIGLWFGPIMGMGAAAVVITLGLVSVTLGRVMPTAAHALRQAWLSPNAWPQQLALSGAILACNLFGFWAAARAVGVALPVDGAFLVLPLTLLVMLVPITLNGWGLREGAAALLWPLAGTAAESAVAASVVFGLAVAIAALIGAAPVAITALSAYRQDTAR